MEQFSFERLDVYKDAMNLVMKVYDLSDTFPSQERFALTAQVNRAVVSITSNIAESCGRTSLREKLHFLEFSYGSIFETYSQLQVAVGRKYISDENLTSLKPLFFSVSRQLNALSKSYRDKLNP